MRTAFINWLCAKAKVDSTIILLTADLGYSVIEPFAAQFPDQFINVGVAEQNMVGIAAGLASEGYRPYTYSIGIFPTFRCAEQMRNDIDYHKLPVVSCSTGSGVTYGALGYTHHMIQDVSLMRSLPNMMIATPSDPAEVVGILDWQIQHPSPLYLRMHKGGDPLIHSSPPSIQAGQWLLIHGTSPRLEQKQNQRYCIVVAGSLAPRIISVLKKLAINIPTYSIPLWGQSIRFSQEEWLSLYDHVISVEDHLLDGGFGSWLLETVSILGLKTRIQPVALDTASVGVVASEDTLLEPLLKAFEQAVRDLER